MSVMASLMLALSACSTAMQVDPALQSTADVLPVKGRQGWLINQKLSFGPYKSDRVQRGWTKSYDIPFVVRFQGAREKLHFELSDGALRSEVFCLGKITTQDLPILNDLFSIPLKNDDVFTAAIYLPGRQENWKLLVENPNKRIAGQLSSGVLKSDREEIRLEEARHTDAGYKNLGNMVLGYHFVQDGRVVGAVELLNNGRVALDRSLPAERRFLLANAAAALLLRRELADQIDQ
jgi:hypothetical protein